VYLLFLFLLPSDLPLIPALTAAAASVEDLDEEAKAEQGPMKEVLVRYLPYTHETFKPGASFMGVLPILFPKPLYSLTYMSWGGEYRQSPELSSGHRS
jgi:hypothetical protein